MNRLILEDLLRYNVLVIGFNKRTTRQFRQMICTKSNFVLSSFQGRVNLNFRNPKYGPPDFDLAKHNLEVVWDILVQDYRLIPCESVSISKTIPEKAFWKFYNEAIYPMSQKEKIKFMNP